MIQQIRNRNVVNPAQQERRPDGLNKTPDKNTGGIEHDVDSPEDKLKFTSLVES